MNNKVKYIDLGKIDYKEAWNYQEKLFDEIVESKKQSKKDEAASRENYLLFCEHPHVYTLGKSGEQNNLLISDEFLEKINATYYKINRGGDITYHGPGQIVGYPILDLEDFNLTVKKYIFYLEEAIINLLKEYNIQGNRLDGGTGVWLDVDKPSQSRKISAIGVRASKFVTMHGFAFNVNTDLNYFNYINPCGFTDKGVTSMQKELGEELNIEEIKNKLKGHIKKALNMNFLEQ
ncbi:MAG: lipoyl(octanoyl) transferase LipB [Bacteroidota bacterium]